MCYLGICIYLIELLKQRNDNHKILDPTYLCVERQDVG